MTIITSTAALAEFCARQSGADFLAVDTEFMRDKTFWPQLCLVQVAGPDEAVAIDPLAEGIDLAPLFALMVQPSVVKVFHAARQDIEIVHHLGGVIPNPLFDTQIAAMVCGFGDSVSYETLVSKLASARIDKSSRFTDWSQRPLSERQVAYALADVTYLRTVYQKLRRKLDRSGRAEWLEQEMAVLADPRTYRQEPDEAWRRLKLRSGKPRFRCIVRELAAWRDREAQARNVPRGRILRDEVLLELAAHAPTNAEELARIRGIGRSFAEGRAGEELIAAIARGRSLPEDSCPAEEPFPEPAAGVAAVAELLRVLLKMKCDDHRVAARLVASGSELDAIAADDHAAVPALSGWRRALFGEDALALKHGKLALAVIDQKLALLPIPPVARDTAVRAAPPVQLVPTPEPTVED